MFKRQLTSAISAFVLAVHMLVGCCAHHDHNELCSNDPSIASLADHDHDVADHDHDVADHHDDATDPAHDLQHQHGCGDGPCVFLTRGKDVLTKLYVTDLIVPVTIETTLYNPTPAPVDRNLLGVNDISPHLRTHLAKCVLRV